MVGSPVLITWGAGGGAVVHVVHQLQEAFSLFVFKKNRRLCGRTHTGCGFLNSGWRAWVSVTMAMACLLASLATFGGTQAGAGGMDTDMCTGMDSVAQLSVTAAVLQLQAERAALHDLVTDPDATRDNDAATTPATLGSADFAVRRSSIAGSGRGTFALRDFARGDVLTEYRCRVFPHINVGYDTTRSWIMNNTHSCDGSMFPLNNPALYANSIAGLGTCGRRNAKTEVSSDSLGVWYVATTDIKAGDEILNDYGREYFKMSSNPQLTRVAYECNMLPLTVAASCGDLREVKRLVGAGAEIDGAVEDDWTALLEASGSGHATVVQYLLEQGADVDRADTRWGRTALYQASRAGHADVVEVLLGRDASDGSAGGRIDVNKASVDGATPLYAASVKGHATVVQLLRAVEAVDANQPQKKGLAPLHSAAKRGDAAVLQALLSPGKGIGVNLVWATVAGATPLYLATEGNHVAAIRVLVAHGADVNIPSVTGATPLYIATQNDNPDAIRALCERGTADPSLAVRADGYMVTPMILAAYVNP